MKRSIVSFSDIAINTPNGTSYNGSTNNSSVAAACNTTANKIVSIILRADAGFNGGVFAWRYDESNDRIFISSTVRADSAKVDLTIWYIE